nr:phosphatidylglycerophosphatase A [uncultured Limnohabitans sp.]
MTQATASEAAIRQHKPNAAFMLSHPAHVIALGFGSGLAPKAPGTVGSLWGWLSWLVLQNYLSPSAQITLIVFGLLLGWWACTVTARNMGISDPGSIVWDEIIAIWLIFYLVMPSNFGGQLAAFVLFRFFDAAKPGPVAWADQLFKGFGWRGGFGIMWDDIVAAFCTLLTLALWRWFHA